MNNGEQKCKPKRESYKIEKERLPKEPVKLSRECIDFRKFLKTYINNYL
jgi:hypothetical protein